MHIRAAAKALEYSLNPACFKCNDVYTPCWMYYSAGAVHKMDSGTLKERFRISMQPNRTPLVQEREEERGGKKLKKW
jgi:hypothetical protein